MEHVHQKETFSWDPYFSTLVGNSDDPPRKFDNSEYFLSNFSEGVPASVLRIVEMPRIHSLHYQYFPMPSKISWDSLLF